MKRFIINMSAACSVVFLAGLVHARDLGVLVLPIHQGKFTSSLLYDNLKMKDDFDTRATGDFTTQITGAQFSYGLTDQVAVAVKGGTLIDSQEDVQGSQWQSRSGFMYGIDLYNEIFPATPGWLPGIQLSGGVSGFQIPYDRLISAGTVTLIDQKQAGIEYHGAVVSTFKVGPFKPYAGLRGFGSSFTWRDNSPAVGQPAHITGHADGNISVVAGLPVQISKDVRFEAEGRFIHETAVTVGFTIAAF